MGVQEVVVRGTRLARHRLDDLEWTLARPLWRRRWCSPSVIGRSVERPLGFLTDDRARKIRDHDPEGAEALVSRAEEVLRGEIRVLGRLVALPARVGLDPISGYQWPSVHGKRVDYRGSPANPKWIWEIERCQELPILTGAWLVTGDETYANAAAASFERWAAEHPPGRGIAWPNGFEPGIRAISLAVAFDALAAKPPLQTRLESVALRTLRQHGRWIERDPSSHSSANNHRIGELVGLLAIGRLAPELPEAQSWTEKSLAELRLEAGRQILPDGTGAEQSFAYTLFVLDLLLIATALLDVTKTETPPEILDALTRASHALWAQVGTDEPELDYGDRDDGRALRIGGYDERGARAIAAALCARLGDPYARATAGKLDSTALWLFGAEGADRFTQTEPAPRPGSLLLPDSGIAVLRSGDTRVTVDGGPLGYLSLAAHGHSDALSITVAAEGRRLVVDPGTGTYDASTAGVRDAFRGTGFHATVAIDGADQSVSRGPFLWSNHARAWFVRVDLAELVTVTEHDGYYRLPDPVRHRRMVQVLAPDRILIYDRLDAASEHEAAVHWPLAHDLRVQLEGMQAIVAQHDDVVLSLVVAATQPGVLEFEQGSETPFAGWVSPRLEELVPAPRLTWRTALTSRVDIATLLFVRPARGFRPALGIEADRDGVEISFLDDSDCATLRVSAT